MRVLKGSTLEVAMIGILEQSTLGLIFGQIMILLEIC